MSHLIDLTGNRYGRLVVIKRDTSKKGTFWVCKCDCGAVKSFPAPNLKTGNSTSCGCFQKENQSNKRSSKLIGKRFGKLQVVSKSKRKLNGHLYWKCQCDCGNFTEVSTPNLKSGSIKSCGCDRFTKLFKHGLCYTNEYKRWRGHVRRERSRQLDLCWTHEMETVLSSTFPSCVICGCTEESHLQKYGTRLHTDHVKPLSKGYGLKPGNAIKLCASCNATKVDKDLSDLPTDWREKIVFASNVFKVEWDKYISQKEIRNNV